jgi:cytochrome c-type biogenesis protein CcmH
LILPFLLALVAFLALLPILTPLLRGRRPAPVRASFDQAVYRDQLRELDRDIARGLLTSAEADAARLEIQRRLLAADKQPVAPPRLSRSPILAIFVFLLIGLGSVGSYLWLGAPGVPDEPFSSRKAELAETHQAESLQQAADALATKLRQDPSNTQGWLLYARTLAMLSQWDAAEGAYRHAIDLGQTGPDVLGDDAEMMVMQAGGTVTPAAEAAFRQVLKADPANGLARYYLAVAAMQAGEPRRAIDGFQALLADVPANSPLRAQLAQKVAEAAKAAGIPVPELAQGKPPSDASAQAPPGPDAAAVAAAANMTEQQRQAMIQSMVAKLPAEQAANPSNLEGWLRLGRAYTVLHEPAKAAEAFEDAAALKPDDMSIPLQEARALMADRTPADHLPPKVISLLKHVEASDPDEPLVLWYLGLAAAQDSHPDEARRYWSTLLAKIPAGTDDSRMVQSALQSLSGGKPASGSGEKPASGG